MSRSSTLKHPDNKLHGQTECRLPASFPVVVSRCHNCFTFKPEPLQIVFHLADAHIHAQWCNITSGVLSASLPRSWLKSVVLVLSWLLSEALLCVIELHTSKLLVEGATALFVDLFHDLLAPETYLVHIVESHKHIGVDKFSFFFFSCPRIKGTFCRGMCFPLPNQY